MYKKFLLVVSFVVLAAMASDSRAVSIDVNNGSFEYDVNGLQITELTNITDAGGWSLIDATGNYAGWCWVSTAGGWGADSEPADGNAFLILPTSDNLDDANEATEVYQILEDPDAVIVANRRYILTFNAIRSGTDTPSAYGAMFYSTGEGEPNHVILASGERTLTSPAWGQPGYAGYEEITVTYTSLPGAASIGKSLGLELSCPVPWIGGVFIGIDNVRAEWVWATTAWAPEPADGEEDVAKSVVLSWKPGVWADAHDVYFGTNATAVANADTTDLTGIYQGQIEPNSYDPPGLLSLGTTYYWRVDEVNDSYSGTDPAPGPWTGEVWSFRVTGLATNPSPADGAENVSAEVTLSWAAGTDATAHGVYFGTSFSMVDNATTADPAYKGIQAMPDVDYAPGFFLTFGQTYYWRIDAISAVTIKGHVWSFTVAPFNVVDDFESYINHTGLKAAWNDYQYGPGHTNHGYAYLNTDANFTRDGNSMMFTYNNSKAHTGTYYGSWATGLVSKIPVGNDWTAGGVEALVLYFYGKAGNWITQYDRMYVRLADGATPSHAGVVRLPDMNDVAEASWHEWNIDLADPAFSTVVKTNVTSIRIGFGGADGGGGNKAGGTGTMYFDDIQLWPPRCRPEIAQPLGDYANDDCTVGTAELEVMASDWAKRGVWAAAAPPASPPEVWYRFEEGSGTATNNSGSWGSQYNITFPGGTANPTWVTGVDKYEGSWALNFDGSNDYLTCPNTPDPNKFAGTNNMTITTWIKGTPQAWDGLVFSAQPPATRHATGLGFGAGAKFMYCWNESEWWWDPGFPVPTTNLWTFMAIAVEPTKATAYMYDGTTFRTASNAVAHGPLQEFDTDCLTTIGQDAHATAANYFLGKMDDVRLYKKTLTTGEVMGIAGKSGYAYVPLASDADLVVGNKNPTYPNVDDQIDFVDFAKLADAWLDTYLWP